MKIFTSFVPDIRNIEDLEWYTRDIFGDLNYISPNISHIYADILEVVSENKNVFHATRETLVMTTPDERRIFKLIYNQIYDVENGVFFNLCFNIKNIDTLYSFLRRYNDCFIFVRMKIKDIYFYVHIYTKFVFTLSITYLHSIFITEYVDIFFDLWRAYPINILQYLVRVDHQLLNLQDVCITGILRYKLSCDQLPKIILKGIALKSVINDWHTIINKLGDFVERQKAIEYEIWRHDLGKFEIKQHQKKSLAYLRQQALTFLMEP